ncbi:hypothetical protein D5086_015895 [Populus alba]|uniref:Uncharacterized protein n=1 Tax=Populus alba TaxID=43335 RepID=A0ACC4BSG9_POPAL
MCDMGNMHFTSEAFEMSCQETFMTNYVVEQIDHPVLITECLLDPVQSRSKMAELLFSTYGVPSVVEEKDNDQGKGEDTSDAKDEDRQLYKLMSKDNDDDDKGLDEDETELACVSSRLQLMPFFVNATLSNTNEIFLSYFYICFAMNSELFQVSVLIFQLSLDLHFISHGIVCPDFVVTPSS